MNRTAIEIKANYDRNQAYGTGDAIRDICDCLTTLQENQQASLADKALPVATHGYEVAAEWRDKYTVAKIELETAKMQCQKHHNESQNRRALLDKQAREIGNLGRRIEDLKDETSKLRVDLHNERKVSARLEQLYRDERAMHLVQDGFGGVAIHRWNDTKNAQTEERILAVKKVE